MELMEYLPQVFYTDCTGILWMLIFKDIKTKIKEIRSFQISDTLMFGPIK